MIRILRRMAIGTAAMMLLGWAGHARAGFSYDTTPQWDGSQNIQPFGNPNTSTYGETIVASASANVLQNFTFFVQGAATLSIQADVYQWTGPLQGNGGQAIGSALYSSPTSISYVGDSSFQAITVNTGGTVLTPGTSYVLFFTISNPADYAASSGLTDFGLVSGHPADGGGGGFVFDNNGNNFGALTSGPWDTFFDAGDLAFVANFSPSAVPEPSSIALTGMACLMGLAYGRRRLKRLAA